MEEIDLKSLMHFFVKKIPMLVLITFITLSLGLGYSFFLKKPLYKGETTLILVQDNEPVTQSDLSFSRNLVTTYTKIIKSKKVINDALKQLDLDIEYDEMVDKISVSSEDDTEMIKIAVSDRDATLASNLANAIANAFKDEIVNIYNLKNVYVFEVAEVEEKPYNVHVVRDVAIYTLIGMVLAIMIIFMIYYFDTSVKSSEELEEKLQLAVLGNVPLYKSRKSDER